MSSSPSRVKRIFTRLLLLFVQIATNAYADTSTTWFDSTANWPPVIRNNPYATRQTDYGFFVNFWGECSNNLMAPLMKYVNPAPYDGTYSGANPANGAYEFYCENFENENWPDSNKYNSHISIDTANRTFGAWLRTDPFRCDSCLHNGSLNYEPLVKLPTRQKFPFTNNGKDYIEISWHMRVQPPPFTATNSPNPYTKIPHDMLYLTFMNEKGRFLTVGIQTWDIRGKTSDTCRTVWLIDPLNTGTPSPVANSCLDETSFDGEAQLYHKTESGQLSWSQVWDNTYTVKITKQNFEKIIKDANSYINRKCTGNTEEITFCENEKMTLQYPFSTWDQYTNINSVSLEEVTFNQEIGKQPGFDWSLGNGFIGIARWNWTVKKYTAPTEVAQCTIFSADDSKSSILLNDIRPGQSCRSACNANSVLPYSSRVCYWGTTKYIPVIGSSFESASDLTGWTLSHNCAAGSNWSISRYNTSKDSPIVGGGNYALRLHTSSFASNCPYAGAYATSPVLPAAPNAKYYINNYSRNSNATAGSRILFSDLTMRELSSNLLPASIDSWAYNPDVEAVFISPPGAKYLQFRYELNSPISYSDMDLLSVVRTIQ